MEEEKLHQIWEKFDAGKETRITKDMIETQIKPRILKHNRVFIFTLAFYLLFVMACIVMLSMNLPVFSSNPVMLAVEAGLLLFSIICFVYGLYIFITLRDINNYSKNLAELIRDKIKFIKVHYEIWLVIIAIMVNVLSFAIGTYIDNVDGTFRINRTGVFIGVTLAVFFFIYGINKFSSWLYTRDLKNYLRDLENSTLDNSMEVEKRRRRAKPFIIAAFIIFTLLLIYGIIRALNLYSAAS